MLTIRKEQMNVFEDERERDFVDRVMQFLKERHTAVVEDLSDDVLRQRVQVALERGRNHGLTWESSLVGFVALMFEVAPNFDQHPAFKRALSMPIEDENERIRAIYKSVSDAQWHEAQEYYDPSAWSRNKQPEA